MQHTNAAKSKKILFTAALNSIVVVLELVYGTLSRSLALITDALHNLSDVLALFIALIALYYAAKAAHAQMTFGYIRAEMMAAFINSLFLTLTMLIVLYEAFMRLLNPLQMEVYSVMVVAAIALVVNGVSAYVLRDYHELHHHHAHEEHEHHEHDHHHEDLNLKAAYLHMLGDAAISLGVILGALATLYFDTPYIDPLLTFAFGLYILKSSFGVLRESFLSLMDANPEDVTHYTALLLSFDEVRGVHDVHLTLPSSKEKYFSAHIVFDADLPLSRIEQTIEAIRQKLHHLHAVTHTLLQPESTKYLEHEGYCTPH
ncbi:MAG: hypothetical protein KU28_01835 [Sulfurovum sp. PC08-66]|nr:MAG: hypothetical protein KU28_01835 [Sulfurovum sp. PC08-66]KIM12673.1 MAG: hypothetical protein KU37_01940 [Sulfuricurvum sp. PC08-66]